MCPRQFVHVVLVVACVVLLTGCRLVGTVDLTVERDGSGQLAVSVAADADLLAAAERAGVDPLGELAQAGRDLAAKGWRTELRDEGDGQAVVLSRSFADAEQLEQLSAELAAGLAAPELAPLQPFRVELTDDRVVVAGGANLQPTPAVGELGLEPADAVRRLRDTDAALLVVRLRLPGRVLETSAETVDGGTLEWQVEPGEAVAVDAVSTRPAARLWPLVFAAAGLLVIVLVAVLRVYALRRRAVVERFVRP